MCDSSTIKQLFSVHSEITPFSLLKIKIINSSKCSHIVAHFKNEQIFKKFLCGQMSKFGSCIRARCNVKVIHFFWHLPSKMLQISIVISSCESVWDYGLHLHDVWAVCFYGIKRLTFKLVQLLMLGACGEWCLLPTRSFHLCSLQGKSQWLINKEEMGNTIVRGTVVFSFYIFCGTQSWRLFS